MAKGFSIISMISALGMFFFCTFVGIQYTADRQTALMSDTAKIRMMEQNPNTLLTNVPVPQLPITAPLSTPEPLLTSERSVGGDNGNGSLQQQFAVQTKHAAQSTTIPEWCHNSHSEGVTCPITAKIPRKGQPCNVANLQQYSACEQVRVVLFIRHGVSICNLLHQSSKKGLNHCPRDSPLALGGKDTCEKHSLDADKCSAEDDINKLKRELFPTGGLQCFQHVITSPLRRCIQTALLYFAHSDTQFELQPLCAEEVKPGDKSAIGLTKAQLQDYLASTKLTTNRTFLWQHFTNVGEDEQWWDKTTMKNYENLAAKRANAFSKWLHNSKHPKWLAIVSHGQFLRTLLQTKKHIKPAQVLCYMYPR
eukprot:TRINITY_DN35373_c0_g1_i1.p1 TRINITY_DN35373_c0_g1~~TRINITY_DN35373_c0_g1_i1.p1  ORF type:complete len:385 (+),score=19.79 TRINITY_DN35373_c0_g1_i1:61-1155(+)